MKSRVPWSVKGIEPEAREAAKDAARRAGMTVGEWLNHVIIDAGEDEPPRGRRRTDHPAFREGGDAELDDIFGALSEISDRLESTERTSSAALNTVTRSVEETRARLHSLETGEHPSLDPDSNQDDRNGDYFGSLEQRLQAIEDSVGKDKRLDSLRQLEESLAKAAAQIGASQQATETRLSANEKAVHAIQTEIREQIEAESEQTGAALQEIRTAIEGLESRFGSDEGGAGSPQEYMEMTASRLRALGEELKRSDDRLCDLEQSIEEVGSAAEASSSEATAAQIEATVERTVQTMLQPLEHKIEALSTAVEAMRRSAAAPAYEPEDGTVESAAPLAHAPTLHDPQPEAEDLPHTEGDAHVEYDDLLGEIEAEAEYDSVSKHAATELEAPADPIYPEEEEAFAEDDTGLNAGDVSLADLAEDHDLLPAYADDEPEPDVPLDPPMSAQRFDEPVDSEESSDLYGAETSEAVDEPEAPPENYLEAARRAARAAAESSGGKSSSRAKPDETPKSTPSGAARGLVAGGVAAAFLALGAGALVLIPEARAPFGSLLGSNSTASSDAAIEGERGADATANEPNLEGATEVARDVTELQSAAASGDPSALTEVARLALAGETPGLTLSEDEAAQMLLKAAYQNHTQAQFELAQLYENGRGLPEDAAAARRWYERAATEGHRQSMHMLAVLHARGDGGPRDFQQAAEWFERAANMGLTDSQYNLGVLYEQGNGVERDFGQAYFWYSLGARSGDDDAARRARAAAANLDPARIAELDARVADWRQTPGGAENTPVQ